MIKLAGIGKAIYRPMKTYSSGMSSRLRFAIAASANPDILLIDEALSTGDTAFKERSENKMTELRRAAGTVFIVNHAAQVIEEMCTRALWLVDGELIGDGPGPQIAHDYRWWSWNIAKDKPDKAATILATCREEVETGRSADPTLGEPHAALPTRSRSMTMRSEESTKTAGRITVYGSCVARDAAREMEQRGWSVERYIARQSLISAGRPADVGDLDLSLLRSSFARRSFLSDMVGNLEAQLTAVASYTDLLLWDLTDERLGVLETAPGTFLTRSTEALRPVSTRGFPPGSSSWGRRSTCICGGLPCCVSTVSWSGSTWRAGRSSSTFPGATRTTSGMSTVPSWGQTAMDGNWVMSPLRRPRPPGDRPADPPGSR